MLQAVVAGKRDPGYLETSRIALEAGLCLALQGEELTEKGHLQGGVLTPAAAMGSVLRERLKDKANIQFEITKTGNEVPTSPLDKLKAGTKAAGMSSGEKNAAAASGANRQARHDPMSACVHALGANLRRGVQQREKFAHQVQCIVGLEHMHPAVKVLGRSFRHSTKFCSGVLQHHQHALQTWALDWHNKVGTTRDNLHSTFSVACAENRACRENRVVNSAT